MRTVHFHEDDFCQQELLPIDSLEFCQAQLSEIEEFSKEHWVGNGWNDIYVRKENPRTLIDLNIHIDTIRPALVTKLPEYEVVTTGYSTHVEECKNTYGFGSDKSGTIFVHINDKNIVDTIWSSDPMREFLDIPLANEMLFVDWAWRFFCPLADRETFLNHVAERDEHMKEFWAGIERERALRKQAAAERKKWWKFW